MIKFILVYYTSSKYLTMKKQHIKIFNNMNDLVNYRTKLKIKKYEIYKQIV